MIFQFPFEYPRGGGELQSVFATFQEWGLQDFFIPFILLFAIIYAVLQRVGLFHTKVKTGTPPTEKDVPDRRINGLLAFVIAMMVVIPHVTQMYPPDKDPINIINTFLPNTAIILMALLLAFILVGLVSKRPAAGEVAMLGRFRFLLGFIGLIAVIISVVKAVWPAFGPEWLYLSTRTQTILITVGTAAFIIWFGTRERGAPKKKLHETLETWLGKTAEEASR